jgi:hypothetical protein
VKPRYNRWETAQDRRREGVDFHWTSTRRSYSNATGKQRLTSRLTAMLDAVLARVADGVVALSRTSATGSSAGAEERSPAGMPVGPLRGKRPDGNRQCRRYR